MRKEIQKNFSVGIALLLLGLILIFGKNQKPPLNSSFAGEPVEVRALNDLNKEGKVPFRVIIPDLGIDLEVKKAKNINGYWEVFENSAGWGEGSGFPGSVGNQVIFAHAREGLFLPLSDIKTNMNIYVIARNEQGDIVYSYTVVDIEQVYPDQAEVIEETTDETLTLYTCSGFRDDKRLIVVAKRVQLN